MEGLMEKQIRARNKTPLSLTMHKNNSQIIAKTKPKIRIIHIFAPEIIKTDTANFREIVQKLTGKPTTQDEIMRKKQVTKPRIITSSSNKKMELAPSMMRSTGILIDGKDIIDERIKGEEEIWKSANSGGGFLGGFAEIDGGFMQELNYNNHFPFLESTTQMDVYGESQLTTC
ncbi:hypothetical protein ACJIZ3_025790 [Penstemon smallii]|uniref:VQ domain-containing protein n=1 Tax=Penstemon smallii TaxID=265156 RepID=A0ABD3TVJ3_9LAMI